MQGDKAAALRIARTLATVTPRSGAARRALVRTLITPPIAPGDLAEARAEAEMMIALWEDQTVRKLYVDVLIARHHVHETEGDVDASLAAFAIQHPDQRFAAVRRFLVYLLDAGDHQHACDLASRIAEALDLDQYWTAAHEIALRAERTDTAIGIEQTVGAKREPDGDLAARLAARRLERAQLFIEASQVMARLKPTWARAHSIQLLNSLSEIGAFDEVLAHLDNSHHSLSPVEEVAHRFNALFARGDVGAAMSLMKPELAKYGGEFDDIRLFRLLRDGSRYAQADADEALLDLIEQSRARGSVHQLSVDTTVRLLFEIDRLDEIEAIAADPTQAWQLDVLGLYALALTHYCRRRFSAAVDLIDRLGGTVRHWEAEKLRARITFESGEDALALEDRARLPRFDGQVDEVTYHALLHQQRYAEAFSVFVSERDRRRSIAAFGDSAEIGAEIAHVGTRAVVMQDGPGDEVQLAGTYNTLLDTADELIVTCDPRLATLLRRSFPNIRFLPTERMRSRRHPGFCAPDRPPRPRNAVFDLLDESAFELVRHADHVMLGRSLPQVSLMWDEPPTGYLIADRSLVHPPPFGPRVRPRLGIVWRSEFASAMRSIHYLRIQDLRPLLALDADWVVLQHDATPDELWQLGMLAKNPPIRAEHIDLRDDLDAAAALLTHLDGIAGIGTTMMELAGGLGLPAVLMHPTRFGSWRADPDTGMDYWHRNTTVVGAAAPDDPESCAVSAAAVLSQRFG